MIILLLSGCFKIELRGEDIMKKIRNISIVMSIVMMMIGVCFVFFPYMSATVLCYILGIILLVSGIIKMYYYFHSDIVGYIFHHYGSTTGILDIILGIIVLLHPKNLITLLPIFIGFMIIMESAFKFHLTLDFKYHGFQHWWYILLSFILSIIFAFILILNPFEGSMALMILVGISLVIDSIQNTFMIHYFYKYYKDLIPIDAEFRDID